jgi:DNA-binding IclR family transcriptional regulator
MRQATKIAEDGLAVSNEEFQPGLVGVAAAFSVRPSLIAAIGPVGASSNRQVLRSSEQVVGAAKQLGRLLEARYQAS